MKEKESPALRLKSFCEELGVKPAEVYKMLDAYTDVAGTDARNFRMLHTWFNGFDMEDLADAYSLSAKYTEDCVRKAKDALACSIRNKRDVETLLKLETIKDAAKVIGVQESFLEMTLNHPDVFAPQYNKADLRILAQRLTGYTIKRLAKLYGKKIKDVEDSLVETLRWMRRVLPEREELRNIWNEGRAKRTWAKVAATYGVSSVVVGQAMDAALEAGYLSEHGMQIFDAWARGVEASRTALRFKVSIYDLFHEVHCARSTVGKWVARVCPAAATSALQAADAVSLESDIKRFCLL